MQTEHARSKEEYEADAQREKENVGILENLLKTIAHDKQRIETRKKGMWLISYNLHSFEAVTPLI